MHGRKKPSSLLEGTASTGREVQNLNEIRGMLSERRRKQRRAQELAEIMRLLSQHFLVEWLSPFEALSGANVLVIEDLYEILMFVPLQNLHLEVSRLLKSRPVQYLWCDGVYSQPLASAGRRRKLSSPKMSLLKVCIGILAHVE